MKGEELWIGDLKITKDIENRKRTSSRNSPRLCPTTNMSQQALIAALNAQARRGKKSNGGREQGHQV